MNIPYILDERPDTGLTNSKLGIWIFLASEVMLFGGLFSAYVFLRIAAPEGDFDYWGAKLSVPMATFNTLVLITSMNFNGGVKIYMGKRWRGSSPL